MVQRTTRSILDELDHIAPKTDHKNLLESRAGHVMQSAINLLNYISAHYSAEVSADLERRLLNGIRNRDTTKFANAVRKIDNENR